MKKDLREYHSLPKEVFCKCGNKDEIYGFGFKLMERMEIYQWCNNCNKVTQFNNKIISVKEK